MTDFIISEEQADKIREEIMADDLTIPILCLPPMFTREDVIWAIRHPNKKRPRSQYAVELRSELTPEEEKILAEVIERHKETLKLLAE